MAAQPGVFLRASWRQLLMLNYPVDPGVLDGLVPAGTELDFHAGRTFLSVVGFRFLRTRVLGVPVPLHRNFDEVNLRFYVQREAPEGRRRGVVFVKELVPRRLLAWVARTVYGENYVAVPMRHELQDPAPDRPGRVAYRWALGARWHSLRATYGPAAPAVPAPDSEAGFIAEHYWGYTRRGRTRTEEYAVEHPPWRVWPAAEAALDVDVGAVYGERFVRPLSGPPSSAFIAEGSDVLVRRSRPLTVA